MTPGTLFTVHPLFELPVRPPTPPKNTDKHIDEAIQFLEPCLALDQSSSAAHLSTPPATSSPTPIIEFCSPPGKSRNDTPRRHAKSQHKHIRFSSPPRFCGEDVSPGTACNTPTGSRTTPSGKDKKSTKSILKPFTHTRKASPNQIAPAKAPDFANTLEAIVQQLASPSSESRLDAYLVLTASLKTYNGVSDLILDTNKLSLLEQFFRRDLTTGGAPDNQLQRKLVSAALKLISALIYSFHKLNAFSVGFMAFVVERAITVLKSTKISKEHAKEQLFLLTMPSVWEKAAIAGHADKILEGLDKIHEKISGSNIISLRLVIYNRLITYYPQMMLSQVHHWLPHVFHALLSNIKDVRAHAIATGVKAGVALGGSNQMSEAMVELLDRQTSNGELYLVFVVERLKTMLKSEESCLEFPRIWSVVVLCIRSKQICLFNWSRSKQWFRLIQTAFNSTNPDVTIQAFKAWRRLIYAVDLDHGPSVSKIKTLREPIRSVYRRRLPVKHSSRIRHAVLQTYALLLYYGFRPNGFAEQTGVYWQELIVEVLPTLIASHQEDANYIAQILVALFLNPASGIWRPQRAIEINRNPLEMDELPRLDPQWLRKNIGPVLKTVEQVLTAASWSYAGKLWTALMNAIKDAGRKEVKVSNNLKAAIAHIINTLQRVVMNAPSSLGSQDHANTNFVARFCFLVVETVETIGALHFSEPFLAQTDEGWFKVVTEQTGKTASMDGTSQAPISCLFQLFSALPNDVDIDNCLTIHSTDLLKICCRTQTTQQAQVRLQRRCTEVLRKESESGGCHPTVLRLWRGIARSVTETLEQRAVAKGRAAPDFLGQTCYDAIAILEFGLLCNGSKDIEASTDLYNAIEACAKREAGTSAVILAVTEPLVDILTSNTINQVDNLVLCLASRILRAIDHAPSSKMLDFARETLWNASVARQTVTGLGWFKNLCTLIEKILSMSYGLETPAIGMFLKDLCGYLESPGCPLPKTLLQICQPGIGVWVEDKQKCVFKVDDDRVNLSQPISCLWLKALAILSGMSPANGRLLQEMETLICAGFKSRSIHIASATITMWNASFGTKEELVYPPQLEDVLQHLALCTDIKLMALTKTQTKLIHQRLSHENSVLPEDVELFPWLLDTRELVRSVCTPPSRHLSPLSASGKTNDPKNFTEPRSIPAQNVQITSPRLHHNVSQGRVVAMESSLLENANLDVNVLIDGQEGDPPREEVESAFISKNHSSPITGHLQGIKLTTANDQHHDGDDMTEFNFNLTPSPKLPDGQHDIMTDSSPMHVSPSNASISTGDHSNEVVVRLNGFSGGTGVHGQSLTPDTLGEEAFLSAVDYVSSSPSALSKPLPDPVRARAGEIVDEGRYEDLKNDGPISVEIHPVEIDSFHDLPAGHVMKAASTNRTDQPATQSTDLSPNSSIERGEGLATEHFPNDDQQKTGSEGCSDLEDVSSQSEHCDMRSMDVSKTHTSSGSPIASQNGIPPQIQIIAFSEPLLTPGCAITANQLSSTANHSSKTRKTFPQVIIPDTAEGIRIATSQGTYRISPYSVSRISDSFRLYGNNGTSFSFVSPSEDHEDSLNTACQKRKRKAILSGRKTSLKLQKTKAGVFSNKEELGKKLSQDLKTDEDTDEDTIIVREKGPKSPSLEEALRKMNAKSKNRISSTSRTPGARENTQLRHGVKRSFSASIIRDSCKDSKPSRAAQHPSKRVCLVSSSQPMQKSKSYQLTSPRTPRRSSRGSTGTSSQKSDHCASRTKSRISNTPPVTAATRARRDPDSNLGTSAFSGSMRIASSTSTETREKMQTNHEGGKCKSQTPVNKADCPLETPGQSDDHSQLNNTDQSPDRSQTVSSPTASQVAAIARNMVQRLRMFVSDCKSLVLGPQQEPERRELRGLSSALQEHLQEADLRGREV